MKFNGFTSTQSQSKVKQGIMAGVEKGGPGQMVKEQDLVRDLLFVFQGIDGRLIQYSFADDAFVL